MWERLTHGFLGEPARPPAPLLAVRFNNNNNDNNCQKRGFIIIYTFCFTPEHLAITLNWISPYCRIASSQRTELHLGEKTGGQMKIYRLKLQYSWMADRVDRETGGFEAEFVLPLPEEYECPICQLAFRDPVQIEDCGHRFCQSCLQELKRR